MSNFNDVELKNQNLRQSTTMDSGAFANLPGEELSDTDLISVAGGAPPADKYLQTNVTQGNQPSVANLMKFTGGRNRLNESFVKILKSVGESVKGLV